MSSLLLYKYSYLSLSQITTAPDCSGAFVVYAAYENISQSTQSCFFRRYVKPQIPYVSRLFVFGVFTTIIDEHMKLLFWPMFIFAIVQSFFFRERKDFWCIKLKGMLVGLGLIPVLFYTYNGVIGKSPDWINIAIFFISAALAYLYETRHFNREITVCRFPKLAFAVLCIIALLFVAFTFFTPELGIFKDPLTGTYGIVKARL